MKKDDLIALAKERGIEADSGMTKAEIIAAIENGVPARKEETPSENVGVIADTRSENVETAKEDPAVEALKEQNAMLQRQMEELQKQLLALQRPQVIQVAADTERVYFLWQAEVADYNLVTFGPGGMYGSITGKTGTFSVPKNEMSRILDDKNRNFLAKRWLIVVDGLTDDERESLGVAYKDGEIMDRKVFSRMVDLSVDEISEVYRKLCTDHKEMVAKRYYEAWLNRNENVTREKVIALRNITRDMGLDIKAFQQILQMMNASDEEE
jgi:DNA-binding transcriptional MerR regulator